MHSVYRCRERTGLRDTLFSMKIPSISLSAIPSLPSISQMESYATKIIHKGILGIDIGSSSAKIVQLSMEGTEIVLDTYGEMDLGPYGDREARKAVHLTTNQIATMLMDLLQAVDAHARRGAIAVPFSASLITIVELPKRDIDQMDKIIASEAKPFIPVPMDTVILNWFVLSDEAPVETSLAAIETKIPEIIEKQKVMLIATEKEVVGAYSQVAQTDGIAVDFLEVEFFSAARACMADAKGPALVVDLGASTTKLYVMNGHGIVVGTHAIPFGGEAITENIMKSLESDFEKAEQAKRVHGLIKHADYPPHENTAITAAIETSLTKIIDEISKLIKESAKTGGVDVQKIILTGGGACMPGITDAVHKRLKIETVLAQPFVYARGPIILEDVLRDVGPKFAVALGLALRAIKS